MSIIDIEVKISAEREKEIAELSKITSIPEDGLLLLDIFEDRVKDGLVDPVTMLSGQDLLLSIAEKLEYDGSDEAVRAEMIDAIKLMSVYATTRLVPIKIPETPKALL